MTTSEKIVSLHGAVPKGEPAAQVVRAIREALEEAERGEIAAIGFVKILPNGEIRVGFRAQPGLAHSHLITAGCFYLISDIARTDDD